MSVALRRRLGPKSLEQLGSFEVLDPRADPSRFWIRELQSGVPRWYGSFEEADGTRSAEAGSFEEADGSSS